MTDGRRRRLVALLCDAFLAFDPGELATDLRPEDFEAELARRGLTMEQAEARLRELGEGIPKWGDEE